MNKDFSDGDAVDVLLARWQSELQARSAGAMWGAPCQADVFAAVLSSPMPAVAMRAPCHAQMLALLSRHMKLIRRDPMMYVGRMGSFLVANILLAVVYIAARDRVQAQAINRARMLCWMLSSPTLGGCVAAFGLNGETNRVVQEVRGGSYDAFAYLAVHTVLQLLLMATITIFAILPGYAIHTLDPSASFSLGGYYTLTLLAFECVGQLCAALADTLHSSSL